MIELIRKTVEKCNFCMAMVSGLGVLAMGLILFYEVICRYFFNAPTIWAQEVSVYIYMWTMLAAASYTLQIKKHVNVDLIICRLSPMYFEICAFFSNLIGALFCAVISVQSYDMIAVTLKYCKVSATPLRVPLYLPQSALLIGFILLTLQFALNMSASFFTLYSMGKRKGGNL